MDHYCDGSGTPWSTPFSSINWGDTQDKIKTKIKGMVGNVCADITIPVDFNMEATASGADWFVIGRHTVQVQGTIEMHCDCSWSFDGNFSSALGHDIYKFDRSNRDLAGEILTWFGSKACKGKRFNIYLPGFINLSEGGQIDGTPTCDKCKK